MNLLELIAEAESIADQWTLEFITDRYSWYSATVRSDAGFTRETGNTAADAMSRALAKFKAGDLFNRRK